ncbi:MAG: transposase family protein [Acidimicrobiales bacterium]
MDTVYKGTSAAPALAKTGYVLVTIGIRVSEGTVRDLAESLRRRHGRGNVPWRLLDPVAQSALTIAFIRTNHTYAELAEGFGISVSTCWRDIKEGISVLADRGRRISLKDVARLAVKMGWDYLIVDGTHVPAETWGRKGPGQRRFYSGKHKRHGLNIQTVCSPDGELLWAAAPKPGATVDITAARQAGIAEILLSLIGIMADLGYAGWNEDVITGKKKPRGKDMPPAQRAANHLQAQLRCKGERGNARLKHWKILSTELRCRPERCTAIVKAVLALHYMEHSPFASLRAA